MWNVVITETSTESNSKFEPASKAIMLNAENNSNKVKVIQGQKGV